MCEIDFNSWSSRLSFNFAVDAMGDSARNWNEGQMGKDRRGIRNEEEDWENEVRLS